MTDKPDPTDADVREELKKIADDIYLLFASNSRGSIVSNNFFKECAEYIDRNYLSRAAVARAIGENSETHNDAPLHVNVMAETRNQLRAEIRAVLKLEEKQ